MEIFIHLLFTGSAKKRYERTLITTQNGFNPANKVDGTGDNLAIKPVALRKLKSI